MDAATSRIETLVADLMIMIEPRCCISKWLSMVAAHVWMVVDQFDLASAPSIPEGALAATRFAGLPMHSAKHGVLDQEQMATAAAENPNVEEASLMSFFNRFHCPPNICELNLAHSWHIMTFGEATKFWNHGLDLSRYGDGRNTIISQQTFCFVLFV